MVDEVVSHISHKSQTVVLMVLKNITKKYQNYTSELCKLYFGRIHATQIVTQIIIFRKGSFKKNICGKN